MTSPSQPFGQVRLTPHGRANRPRAGALRFRADPPSYDVEAREGPLELRTYAPRIVAVTEVGPESGKPRDEAFLRLAGYIFGGNSRSQKLAGERLAMTSPARRQACAVVPPGRNVLTAAASARSDARPLVGSTYSVPTLHAYPVRPPLA